MRMPKLLQPSPTALTVSEPIVRVSMSNVSSVRNGYVVPGRQ